MVHTDQQALLGCTHQEVGPGSILEGSHPSPPPGVFGVRKRDRGRVLFRIKENLEL